MTIAHNSSARSLWYVNGVTVEMERPSYPRTQYVVRGVCYQHTLVGEKPQTAPDLLDDRRNWRLDLDKMRAMGVNTIKLYGINLSVDHRPFFDAAWNNGNRPIFIIASLWIPPTLLGNPTWTPEPHDPDPDRTHTAKMNALCQNYTTLATTYGMHPALMGMSLGSEINTSESREQTCPCEFWGDFKRIAEATDTALKQIAQTPTRQKIITTGLIATLPSTLTNALVNGVQVDIWGFDVYPSAGEGTFAKTFLANVKKGFGEKPRQPVLITEFGIPAAFYEQCPSPPPPTPDASWTVKDLSPSLVLILITNLLGCWYEIEKHLARSPNDPENVGCGGCIFAWSDEWWKQGDGNGDHPCQHQHTCTPSSHDGGTLLNAAFVGNYWHEEWFGLTMLNQANGGRTVLPRPTYTAFKELWNPTLPLGTVALSSLAVATGADKSVYLFGIEQATQVVRLVARQDVSGVWHAGTGFPNQTVKVSAVAVVPGNSDVLQVIGLQADNGFPILLAWLGEKDTWHTDGSLSPQTVPLSSLIAMRGCNGHVEVFGLRKDNEYPYLASWQDGNGTWRSGGDFPGQGVKFTKLTATIANHGYLAVMGIGKDDQLPYVATWQDDRGIWHGGNALPGTVKASDITVGVTSEGWLYVIGVRADTNLPYLAAWLDGSDTWHAGEIQYEDIILTSNLLALRDSVGQVLVFGIQQATQLPYIVTWRGLDRKWNAGALLTDQLPISNLVAATTSEGHKMVFGLRQDTHHPFLVAWENGTGEWYPRGWE